MHIVNPTISNPTERIKIAVIGAGGTGSYVLQGLAKINLALPELIHGSKGISVDVWDDDRVSPSNIVRQLYREDEIGLYKSSVLVRNINRYYGYNWEAKTKRFDENDKNYHIFLICVDSMKSRREIYRMIKNSKLYYDEVYILDFGNEKDFGQVILSSYIKPAFPDEVKFNLELPEDYLMTEDEEDEPSCSIAQSLGRQKMFINPIIANLGLDLLYDLLTKPYINKTQLYINLNNGKMLSKKATKLCIEEK